LNLLIKEVTEAMESYNLPKAMRPITEFIDELSTWYLRRSRDRFKAEDEKDKQNALVTMKYVLLELAKLMAPFTPFVAESLWQAVGGQHFKDQNRSVHLEEWPAGAVDINSDIIEEMNVARKIAELGLAKRDEAGIKIRQMLGKITVKMKTKIALAYSDLLKDELNIQALEFVASDADLIEVELDTVITPELKQEGTKREIIRFINMLRKDANLSLNDETSIFLAGASEELVSTLTAKQKEITKETLSRDFNFVTELPEVLVSKEIKLEDLKLQLGLKK
jgi:isoleucyl-tRNA synthetase